MADPGTMTVMAAASAATSAYGSIRQGQYAAKAGKYNQRAAYAEAAAQEIQAGQEIAAGSHNASRIAALMRQNLAEIEANAAAGGGSAQDASVVAIRDETVKTSTLDQLLEMTAAEERAEAIRRGAQVTRAEGDMARAEGQMARQAGYLQAGATLLQAGASWSDKFGWKGSGGKGSSPGPARTSSVWTSMRRP